MGVDTGSYVVNITNTGYYISNPSNISTSFSTYFNTDSRSFALQPIPNKQDLQVTLFPLTSARPGFAASYGVQYKNVGTTTINSGTVSLVKDSRLNFTTSVPAPASIMADTLQWPFANFAPGQTASIQINFTVTAPPAANFGDTLKLRAVINPFAGDETPADDTAILKQRVVGSYDPNDKTERNGGVITPAFITNGDKLQYTIRFQNTGNDTAFTVVVRDTLSNKIEDSTLQIIAASHPNNLTINDKVRTWTFNNILLPDSTTNEAASHGYIVFHIRPKATVVAGEIIHNTASIYFDFNLPVLTNDAPTRVQANLATLPQGLLHFYGNLQGNEVRLLWRTAASAAIKSFDIQRSADGARFASVGSIKSVNDLSDFRFSDKIAGISSSTFFYRLKLIQENGGYHFSNLLLFRKGAETKDLLTIAPNPVSGQAFISFKSTTADRVEMRLLNVSGVIVRQQSINVLPGINVYPFSKQTLSPGMYFLHITGGEAVKTTSFVVK